MMGNRVWRGQSLEDCPLGHSEWRAREKRAWRREADLAAEFAPFAAESLEWAQATFGADAESWPVYPG